MDPITGAALAKVGGQILGSMIGGGAGGGVRRMGSSTETVSAPSYIQPQYERIADAIGGLTMDQLGAVQGLSDYERRLIGSGMKTAEAGSPFLSDAQSAVTGLLGGSGTYGEAAQAYRDMLQAPSMMTSPEFVSATQAAAQSAIDPIQSRFALGGRLGSTAFGESLARGVTSAISPLALRAREQDIQGRQAAAAGLLDVGRGELARTTAGLEGAGRVAQMPFQDIERGLALGGLLSQQEFAESQAPIRGIERLTDLTRGATFGQSSTQPLYAPKKPNLAPVLGGAFGEALFKAIV